MPRYQRPTGTLDILPEEQHYWHHVRARARHLAELAGFERIDVPIFEATALFLRGVGEGTDIVDKEMYSFADKGDHEITLRPDFTAGIVRAYIENGMHVLPQPVKLYTFGPIFRYERPQAGRFRQHTQFDVEILGEQDPVADLEVLLLAWDLYAGLGFRDLAFQLNSTGCPQCKPGYVAVLKDYYADRDDICPDCRRRLEHSPLRVLDCKADQCQPAIAGAPHILDYLCDECAEHFNQLKRYLELLKLPFNLNHRLVRGLDYYTRTVFEIQPKTAGSQSTLAGGGRYDDLIEELGGKPTPAIGFAAGMERLILNLKEQQVAIPPLPKPQVFIASLGDKAKEAATKLASDLRGAGVGVILALGDKSLKAQLRQANSLGVRHAVIIGEEEVKAGTVTLRDMTSAEQKSVAVGELGKLLK